MSLMLHSIFHLHYGFLGRDQRISAEITDGTLTVTFDFSAKNTDARRVSINAGSSDDDRIGSTAVTAHGVARLIRQFISTAAENEFFPDRETLFQKCGSSLSAIQV